MMKKCVVIDGRVINIGAWDYQRVAVVNDEGIVQMLATNPFPKGAKYAKRECEQREDGSWYVVNEENEPLTKEKLMEKLNEIMEQINNM